MVIFLYNLYIFVWIQHICVANMVWPFDPSNSVIRRLLCSSYTCCAKWPIFVDVPLNLISLSKITQITDN